MLNEKDLGFAYLAIDGLTQVDADELKEYLVSVDQEVLPGIEALLQAKDEGAHEAFGQLLF